MIVADAWEGKREDNSGATAPPGQYIIGGQLEQVDDPVVVVYTPFEQAVHVVIPPGEKVPRGQRVQVPSWLGKDPFGQRHDDPNKVYPGTQSVHWVAGPAHWEHGNEQGAQPPEKNSPGGQETQVVPERLVPSTHEVQAEAEMQFLHGGVQLVQTPEEEYIPSGHIKTHSVPKRFIPPMHEVQVDVFSVQDPQREAQGKQVPFTDTVPKGQDARH